VRRAVRLLSARSPSFDTLGYQLSAPAAHDSTFNRTTLGCCQLCTLRHGVHTPRRTCPLQAGSWSGCSVGGRLEFNVLVRNTSQDVAANGRSVQSVPPCPRASCTTAQAKAVAYREDAPPRTDSRNTSQDAAANGRRVQNVPPWSRGASCTTAQAKAVAHGGDAPSRAEYRNTSQDVAANGRSVHNVLPWPRSSCTTAQAKAVANGGRSSTHDSQSNKPGRCCQRQKCAERSLVATCFVHHGAGKGGGAQRRRSSTNGFFKHRPGRCCQREKGAGRSPVATCFVHHGAGKGGGERRTLLHA
jgi:hypothetical protein